MGLSIAGRWFERQALDDGVTLLREPHVHAVWRCNIWHVRGRDRDLLIDTGIGVASLLEAAADLFERPLAALATHAHVDHVGGLHEFDERIAHAAAAERLAAGDRGVRLAPAERGPDYVAGLAAAGYDVPDLLLDALPTRGYDVRAFAVRPAPATRLVGEGDVIDLGDRRFTVLHLPGHSPCSIGLWEAATATLFSGDAIYDGPLLDDLPGSDVAAYVATMQRLRRMAPKVVHGGHDGSFGRERLVALADAYLASRRA